MKRVHFNRFETVFLIVGFLTNTFIAFWTKGSLINTIYAYLCVLSGVLLTKARIEGYLLEFTVGLLYLFIAMKQRYYSEMLIGFLLMPISIVGIIRWIRQKNSSENTVNIVNVSKREIVMVVASQLLLFPLYYYLISLFNDQVLVLSTFSLIFSLLANYFIARMSAFNYICFLCKDFVVVSMWLAPMLKGDFSSVSVMLSCLFYMVNDIYGLYNWNRIMKQQKALQKEKKL